MDVVLGGAKFWGGPHFIIREYMSDVNHKKGPPNTNHDVGLAG